MSEFFRGWKRKVGVVTLTMACVFMVGWMRSLTKCDAMFRNGDTERDCFVSIDGTLSLHRTVPPFNDEPVYFHLFGDNYWWQSRDISSVGGFQPDAKGKRPSPDPFELHGVEWRWDWAGFAFGAAHAISGRTRSRHLDLYSVPYWAIVIPLTLISLWLLLAKPRKSNQKKITEPIPEKVT